VEENERGSADSETVDNAVIEASRTAEILDGLRAEKLKRGLTLITGDVSKINEAERTVELSFASEYAVFRRDLNANEVLEMSEQAADLARMNAGGSLLFNHNLDDQIGGVVRAWVDPAQKRAYAIVKFSQSQRGSEFFQDVIDGIRKNVSFYYRIHDGKVTLAKRGSDEPDIFTATRWEAMEISLVSVPADPTVGVGRSADETGEGDPGKFPVSPDPQSQLTESETVEAKRSEDETPTEPEAVSAPAITTTQLERGSKMEREDQILEFGKKFGADDLARTFALDPNKSLEDFRQALLERETAKQSAIQTQPTHLDLSEKNVREYSVMNAIRGIVAGKREGFEFECSQAIEKRLARPVSNANAFYVPVDIQQRAFNVLAGQRDLSVGLGTQPTDGGALVGTDHKSDSFIEVLRSKMLMSKLGARMLSGLVGNVNIPRQNSAGSAYWVAEGVAPTESQLGVAQLSLSPKTVGAVTEFTRLLMLQSAPSIEQLVFTDLAAVIAREIDRVIIAGSGASGQPTGITATTGVDEITLSGASSTFDWSDAVEMETAIQDDNAPEGFAYLTRPGIRGTLKTRAKIGSTYPVFLCGEDNRMNGYPVPVTTQVPASTLIFGDFTQIIVGEWGVLELVANPFNTGFRAGNVEIRGLQTVDVAIRYPESFKKTVAFA
jgi:HK97 family phage major capsid protein